MRGLELDEGLVLQRERQPAEHHDDDCRHDRHHRQVPRTCIGHRERREHRRNEQRSRGEDAGMLAGKERLWQQRRQQRRKPLRPEIAQHEQRAAARDRARASGRARAGILLIAFQWTWMCVALALEIVIARHKGGAFPSPLWGGVRGGGSSWLTCLGQQTTTPSPTLPHKGGGSPPSSRRAEAYPHLRQASLQLARVIPAPRSPWRNPPPRTATDPRFPRPRR